MSEEERSEMRHHADVLMHDADFLAEVVASEAEAARGRYHETEDVPPRPSLPMPVPEATVEFRAGGMRRRSARSILATARFKYAGAFDWIEERHGAGLIGESVFVARGSQESVRYLMERLKERA